MEEHTSYARKLSRTRHFSTSPRSDPSAKGLHRRKTGPPFGRFASLGFRRLCCAPVGTIVPSWAGCGKLFYSTKSDFPEDQVKETETDQNFQNEVQIAGVLAKDPDVRNTTTGKTVANLTVLT